MMDKDQREITQKEKNARVIVLRSARNLMLIDIYMKFREDSLDVFLSYRAHTIL